MNAQDRAYFQGILDAFIGTSIQRLSHSGDMIYYYRVSADEVRQNIGRQRLHDPVISEIEAFFRRANVSIIYNRDFGTFDITLDLSRCILDQAQALFLSTAMTAFRAEHG